MDDISAASAIARYDGPVLLVHGREDVVVPATHLDRLAAAAREARAGDPFAAEVETLIVDGGQHSWLYEDAGYRRAVAGFLTRAMGGPLDASRGRGPGGVDGSDADPRRRGPVRGGQGDAGRLADARPGRPAGGDPAAQSDPNAATETNGTNGTAHPAPATPSTPASPSTGS